MGNAKEAWAMKAAAAKLMAVDAGALGSFVVRAMGTGQPILTIHSDGRFELGELAKNSPDEAAHAFFNALEKYMPERMRQLEDVAKAADRLLEGASGHRMHPEDMWTLQTILDELKGGS